MNKNKTVFFGPFVGEFGWEYLYWHAWVNKVCQTEYKDYRKIISSYPGRESFYSNIDEYWAHPPEILNALKSCNGYIADFWINGYPRPNTSINKKFLGLIPYESWQYIEKKESTNDIFDEVRKLLKKYKSKLPENTVYFIPFEKNAYEDFTFGVRIASNPNSDKDIIQTPIPFSKQNFELLQPTEFAKGIIKEYIDDQDKLIAIYPRNRSHRRTDKNWSKDNYLKLISYFKNNHPEYKIGIFGAPDQAYFDDGVPDGTIDFINLPDNQRMNIQVAALKQSYLAVGSLSGAVLVSRAAGVPTLSWGLQRDADRFHEENRNEIETIFHPVQNPLPEDIEILSSSILNKVNNYRVGYKKWNSKNLLNKGSGNNESLFDKIKNYFQTKFYGKNKDYE